MFSLSVFFEHGILDMSGLGIEFEMHVDGAETPRAKLTREAFSRVSAYQPHIFQVV